MELAARSFFGRSMGIKNYLIEGVSCTGKTSVCDELQRRGYQSIHGVVAVPQSESSIGPWSRRT